MIASDELNALREQINIVDVVAKYIPLTKKGHNYFAVCPFHGDTDPSMSVSEEKQMFHCFSCKASGNVFNFISLYENISYLEAVKKASEICHITTNFDYGSKVTINKNEKLYEIYDLARLFYKNNLNAEAGKRAKEYLNERGITDEIIKEFDIGVAFKNKHDLKTLLSKKYDVKDIDLSGLIYEDLDIFNNRLMFPLTNPFGQVVGFSARVYNGEDTKDVPKYINTKETKIFKKSEILFNYFKAKNNVRINKEIIIVEGQFDLLKCYGCGVTNIVATMGTAFTKEHAVLIKKLNAVPIILFDGDSAGEKGTLACGEELIKVGLNPLVVRLPNNDDPDSYISKNGQDKFLEVLNNRQSFIDFKLQYYKKNKDFKNTNDMATYVNTIIDELSKINDDVLKEITLKKIALESDLEIDFLRSKIKKQDPKEVKKTPLKKVSREEKALINLLFYMLKSTDAINIFDEADIIINNDKYRSLANEIVGFYKAHNYIKIADLMTTIKDDSEMLSLISEIGCLNLKDNFQKEEIYDYIKVIKEINLDKECNLLKEKLKTVITKEEKLTITKKIEELIKEKMKSGGNYERD